MENFQSIKNENKHTRILSIFFVFVFFTQDVVAFIQACNSLNEKIVVVKTRENLSENALRTSEESSKTIGEQTLKLISKNQKSAAAAAGAGQAETSGFSIGSTDGMVDKFTGDFSYNIPLADVEGYPITIQYNSNISMNSDASWVGLGMNLNVGDVSRDMRGLPDEFNGEQTINRTFNQLPESTIGAKLGGYVAGGVVLGGVFSPSLQVTMLVGEYSNSYIGFGTTFDLMLGAKASMASDVLDLGLSGSLGYSFDSKRGIGTNKSIGLSATLGSSYTAGVNRTFGNSFHSRAGLTGKINGLSIEAGYSGNSSSYSSTSVIPYGTKTMVPSVKLNGYGSSFNTSVDFFTGVSGFGLSTRVGVMLQGYTDDNTITVNSSNQIIQPALGYFHSGKRKQFGSSATVTPVMDFNRSNDAEYSEQMKNLSFSFQTYDIFSVNALGFGGVFRGRRQDIGTYYDPRSSNVSDGAGVELSVGVINGLTPPAITFLIDGSVPTNTGGTVSENLKNASNQNVLEFTVQAKSTSFDQAVYFKGVGEMTPEDLTDYNLLGKDQASRIQIAKSTDGESIVLNDILINPSGNSVVNSSLINQSVPTYQASYFKPYTAVEYNTVEPTYESVTSFGPSKVITSISRIKSNPSSSNDVRIGNHLSAIETVGTDGLHYTFGIPAYETLNSQVSFCADGLSQTNGVTTYSSGDNSFLNQRGISHYFDKTDVPAYAHSFLLTKVVSADYIDKGSAGLSMEDIGKGYKINYTREYSDVAPYKWKFPMGNNLAMFNKGNLGTSQDDIASYSYGEKEIWYTHSIESKNLIAEFILNDKSTEPRQDGYGVDQNGALDQTQQLRYVKKIIIYNRSERTGPNGTSAKPLQTIEFEYSYELCKNNPSNINVSGPNSGKLTLKKIRSYSGESREMGIYSYEFTYDVANNQNFSYATADEWGNYKAQIGTKPNDLFPYADQRQYIADPNSKAWKLIKIKNPMGGTIEIDYESDSYATVQDNRAMKHVDVYKMTNLLDFMKIQASSTWDGLGSYVSNNFNSNYGDNNTVKNSLSGWSTTDFNNFKEYFLKKGDNVGPYKNAYGAIDPEFFPNNVIIFQLDTPINGTTSKSDASQQIRQEYFTNKSAAGDQEIKDLYFKLLVNVKPGIEELLPVFGTVLPDQNNVFLNTVPSPLVDDFTSIGVMPANGGQYHYGYVIIEPAHASKKKDNGDDDNTDKQVQMNSLQKAALEYIRRNLPDKVYGSCPSCDGDTDLDFAVLFGGEINLAMNKRNWAQSFITNTTLRLFVANSTKYGGNGRVKSITYKDAWDEISAIAPATNNGEYLSTYKWDYIYTHLGVTTGNAAFEPKSGIDECVLYEWDMYKNIVKKYPDESKFTATPFAIDLFPSPIVGYERTEVVFSSANVNGKSVSEYHTTRLHPFKEYYSTLNAPVHVDEPSRLLLAQSTDLYGFSQGFVVKTNDFHGKPMQMMTSKKDAIGNDIVLSRSTYHYANLGDKVKMIDRATQINEETVAQEVDIHCDSRKVTSTFKSESFGISVMVKFVIPSPIPLIIPLPTYSRSERKQQFNSHALIKHINQSAIVEHIETEYLGSINTAKNILYDKFSGSVLLSSLQDEYNDNLYSLSYPSHWYYKELREKNNTVGSIITTTVASDGTLTAPNVDQLLTPGDLVQLLTVSGIPTVTVAKVYPWPLTSGGLYLMTSTGTTYGLTTGSHQLKIVKSNRDNRIEETMQSVVTKKDPLIITGTVPNTITTIVFPTTEVIEAGSMSYKDKNYYKCVGDSVKHRSNNEFHVGAYVNPYSLGVRGDLVMDGHYSWQGERSNVTHPYKTRFDGAYLGTFDPMYKWNSTTIRWDQINTLNHLNWRKMGEVTTYNQFGVPVESRDQLLVNSSVIYGYNNDYELVPVAQAVNARQQEIAFDGFEDYTYFQNESDIVTESHFDFKSTLNSTISLVNDVRHSGLISLKVAANNAASVTKKVQDACIAADIRDPLDKNILINACNCVKPFEPTPGDYIIGAWVKNDTPLAAPIGNVVVSIAGGQTFSFAPSGTIIDGWQRLEGTFKIPPGATGITVSLQNLSTKTNVYFDDVRIHPELAGMTTVVYDPSTLLPMATHDGSNFTTFYNYDENLNQVRVRVETVEGISTVSETESGGNKSPKQ